MGFVFNSFRDSLKVLYSSSEIIFDDGVFAFAATTPPHPTSTSSTIFL